MSMIQLNSQLLNNEFKVNTTEYASNPTLSEAARIRYIEAEIIQRTTSFLSDPMWFVKEWESLTEEDIPSQYTKDFPFQVSGLISAGGTTKRVEGLALTLLPLMDEAGQLKSYPEERLVADFMKYNQRVYILKDSIYKQLVS